MDKAKAIVFCDRAAEVSLCFVGFSFAISIAMTNVFLGLLIFFWFIKRILTRNARLPRNPLNIFFILLLAVSLYSMVNCVELSSSMGGITRLFKCFIFYFAIVDTINEKAKLRRVIWVTCAGLLLISIDGIFQYLTGKDFIRGYDSVHGKLWKEMYGVDVPRLRASMKYSNIFACYLATVIPLVLSLFLYYLKGVKRLFLALLCLLAIFCMFNTLFRGAALAFIVTIILFSIIKRDLRLAAVMVIFAVALPFLLPKPILKWVVANPNPVNFFIEKGGRWEHWQAALNMIKAHPFVGVGIKTFMNNYALYKIQSDTFVSFNAHSSYLHLAAETGLIGFAIFMAMIAVVIIHWRKAYIKIKEPDLQAISLGLFGAFVAFLTASIMDSFYQSSNMTVLFYFILALLIAANKLTEKAA